jgi:hypothetical protein
VALVPAIKLFGGRFAWEILDEVRDYARAGGQILFGTDVGYLTDFDPTVEYEYRARPASAGARSWRR